MRPKVHYAAVFNGVRYSVISSISDYTHMCLVTDSAGRTRTHLCYSEEFTDYLLVDRTDRVQVTNDVYKTRLL